MLCLPKFVFNQTLEKAEVPGSAEAGGLLFAPNHALDCIWTVLQSLLTGGVCTFVYFLFFLLIIRQYFTSVHWQGAIRKSIQTKGRKAILARGAARKENPDTCPHGWKDLQFTVGGGETRDGEGLSGITSGYKNHYFKSPFAFSPTLSYSLKKISKVKGFWHIRAVVGAAGRGQGWWVEWTRG